MPTMENGVNEITLQDIEDFLNGDGVVPPATKQEENPNTSEGSTESASGTGTAEPTSKADNKEPTETQAFARRLKEATNKARNEERESIAKSLGYDTYADMVKSREHKLLEEKGLDPEEVSPIVDELVKKRLEEDPRMQELNKYRQEQMKVWAQNELAELKELTGGKISTMDEVPRDVLELWKTKGSLKAAYLELNGEKLIREMRSGIASEQSRGSTGHLTAPNGTPTPPRTDERRLLTDKEKAIYKLFNPDVTDEELSKKTTDRK